MKKKLLTSLLALGLLLVLTACRAVSDTKADNWSTFDKTKTITIGFDNTFVPMGFEEKDGSYSGFDIDLANAVFAEYGIMVHWQAIDWNMKETELNNGKIDLIWNGYTKTDERAKKVAFSMPYMQSEQILVTKKSSGITTVADMTDKRLGAQTGSSGYDAFEAEPKLLKDRVKGHDATLYDNFNQALIDLKADRVDAVLSDSVYANYYLNKEDDISLYNTFSAGYPAEEYVVGARKADKTLVEKINQAFIKLYQKGTFQEISKKWFGADEASEALKTSGSSS